MTDKNNSPTTNEYILTQVEWEFNSLLSYAKMDHVSGDEGRIMESLLISINRKLTGITEHTSNPKMHKAGLMWESDTRKETLEISPNSWEFLNDSDKYKVYRLYDKEGKL